MGFPWFRMSEGATTAAIQAAQRFAEKETSIDALITGVNTDPEGNLQVRSLEAVVSTGSDAAVFAESRDGYAVLASADGDGTAIRADAFGAGNAVEGFAQSEISGFFRAKNAANVAPTILAQQRGASQADLFEARSDAGSAVAKIGYNGAITATDIVLSDGDFLAKSTAAFANGAAAQTGTLTNAPTAGNPTKWIAINDNGVTRYIPTW